MSNYTVVPNIRTRMIEIRGGSLNGTKICEFPLDETKEIIQQMIAARKKFEFMIANPLMDMAGINQSIAVADEIFSRPDEFKPGSSNLVLMVNWYRYALLLLINTGASIQQFMAAANRSDLPEHLELQNALDQIDMVVEANKHHLPKSGPARDPQPISTSVKHG